MFAIFRKLFIRNIEKEAEENDIVSRFVCDKKLFSSDKGVLHHNAFVPPKKYPNEISVFCITSLLKNIKEIWILADKYIKRDKPLIARGDLKLADIKKIKSEKGNLSVFIDAKPHKLHGNIKDMPLDKSIQKVVTVQLANISKLHLR